ncbi:MAG: hypothetical protein L7G90_03465 [Candidatus Nanopusillus sp.]|jgi:uncharacterized membrane protein|nr:hypothetical protein [Candidatus Nanopusillus sp.]MCG2869066.1 hypothetical protein [Candidatus Nanopusillus sp.]MCG2883243.1 hypothetical protein [Candidatus Nanopusillus sp.]
MKNLEKRLESILKNFTAMKNENTLKKVKNVTIILMLLPLLILLIGIISTFGTGILGMYSISIFLTMLDLAISQHQNILINITNMEISKISQGINTSSYTYVLFTQWMNTITHITVQDIIKDLTNTIIDSIIFIMLIIIFYIRQLKHKTTAK